MIARQHGWAEFISIQNHYNIIYREDERDMAQLIEEEGMSMTPFSPLAAAEFADYGQMKIQKELMKTLIYLLSKELKKLLMR